MKSASPLLLLASILMLLAFCAFPARAQTAPPKEIPFTALSRTAVAAGVGYDWHSGADVTPQPSFKNEVAAGLYGGYVLAGGLSAYGAAVYGVQNQVVRFSPGVHLAIAPHIAASFTYDYYAGKASELPEHAHEWAIGVVYARALTKTLLFGGSETYSVDNREWRTSIGVRVPLWLGKDS